MANSGADKELMRECVSTLYAGVTGVKNTVFDIDIPEGYVMELHSVEFLVGSTAVTGIYSLLLIDDIDETANPGHTAEKVLASTIFESATAVAVHKLRDQLDTHKQLLVRPPNFITDVSGTITTSLFCRIWFDFIRVSPTKILELLRQQQY